MISFTGETCSDEVPFMRISDPVSRMVIVGDIHGRLDLLVEALSATGLARDGRWTGGDAVLLQTGDLADRGPHGLRCMDLMMSLSRQAREAGGHVIPVLGNHELMALASADENCIGARHMWMRNGGPAVYREWVEREQLDPSPALAPAFHALFSPSGSYGRWIVTRPPAAVVDGVLVTHAGMDSDLTVDGLVREAEAVMASLPGAGSRLVDLDSPVFGEWGPFWNRRLDPAGVGGVCEREGVAIQVIGHTPAFGVTGLVLNVDSGMVYTGSWQVAVREEGRWWAYAEGRPPAPLRIPG